MGEYMDPVMNLVEMGQTHNKVLVDPDRKEARSNFGSSPGLGLGRQYTGGSGWAPYSQDVKLTLIQSRAGCCTGANNTTKN